MTTTMAEIAKSEEEVVNKIVTVDRTHPASKVATLDEFYVETEKLFMRPGWRPYANAPSITSVRQSAFVPMHWRYSDAKPALDAAGRLIDTSLAERRNLIMFNKSSSGIDTVRTIVSAYQMILPGEVARAHRHPAHALRVILDSKGTYSVVNGEKQLMESGDVIFTPGGCWHEHGHEGTEPGYWIDILDMPLSHLLEAWHFEEHPQHFQENAKWVEASPFLFTAATIDSRLEQAKPDPEGFHGSRIVLENPMMPTIELSVEKLMAGRTTRRYVSSANRIFCIMEGTGVSSIGSEEFRWNPGDVIAAPAWSRIEHHADRDAKIFSCNDEPLLRFAKYYEFSAA